jgi:hypothetical protein
MAFAGEVTETLKAKIACEDFSGQTRARHGFFEKT